MLFQNYDQRTKFIPISMIYLFGIIPNDCVMLRDNTKGKGQVDGFILYHLVF